MTKAKRIVFSLNRLSQIDCWDVNGRVYTKIFFNICSLKTKKNNTTIIVPVIDWNQNTIVASSVIFQV
jgi:hypothetical protein